LGERRQVERRFPREIATRRNGNEEGKKVAEGVTREALLHAEERKGGWMKKRGRGRIPLRSARRKKRGFAFLEGPRKKRSQCPNDEL